jgi:hypothetical protein
MIVQEPAEFFVGDDECSVLVRALNAHLRERFDKRGSPLQQGLDVDRVLFLWSHGDS